ncbi:ParB N-terminal domain-containing protein [Streptomyces sp. RCU064]|uniref:ParB N-terminal domain-containing protein n=1 Tax=Streptomyces rugosispiralis TaxID=2967341 RepID=A0ABT1VEM8_9ACTN|nr:ParB N-terminal domain-containing protein [Streptomyces rugosispiralis]MCQ8194971.1 ParB N-terminal domain-containing protein [Streptomyces rugosispiralis]
MFEQQLEEVVVEVDIASISTAESPRSSGEDPEHIQALAETEVTLPPIIVHRSTMRVVDGAHRLRAAELRGDEKIKVTFFDGSKADAFVLAVGSNITHGLPLSMADRKSAAARIIVSHPQWSDRMIASVSGISAGTVAEIRRRSSAEDAASGSRIGQDGRVRPINSAAGRELASRLITADPGLSLRQIARAAGISPETARDVRNRMSRGEDPLPKSRGAAKAAGDRRTEALSRSTAGAATAEVVPMADRLAAVHRLTSDPALRFNETGRRLLRLLNINMLSAEEWQEIIANVPPHCSGIVASLARECAGMWDEIAVRVDLQLA